MMDASTALVPATTANLSHIARFEAKLPPKPLPDTAVTEAFGAWAYPKIVAGLRSEDAVIKSKSIVAARELLVAPEKHIQCIAAGITPVLRDILQHPVPEGLSEADLQAATAATMQLLVAKDVGCRDALQHGCLPPILQLLKKTSAAVRDAAYGCLRAAAMYEPWRTALVREGALPALLMYAQQEEPQRAAYALELLHHIIQARHNQDALTQLIAVQQAIPVLAGMISTVPPMVLLGVIKLLGALAATHDAGRLQAVECGCVPQLLGLLHDSAREVAGAAATALMMLTLAKEGKVAVHQAKGLSACLAVLQMQLQQGHELQETLCSQVLQAITNSAEYGPCNVELQRSPQLQMIKEMAGMEGRSLLAAAATQALRMAGVKKGEAQST